MLALLESLTAKGCRCAKGCTAGEEEEELGPLLLVDTAGCDMEEVGDGEGDDSKCNHGEARVTLAHCSRSFRFLF